MSWTVKYRFINAFKLFLNLIDFLLDITHLLHDPFDAFFISSDSILFTSPCISNISLISDAGVSYAMVLEFGDGTISEATEMNINVQVKLTNYSIDKPLDGEETVTFEYSMIQDGTDTPFILSYYSA